ARAGWRRVGIVVDPRRRPRRELGESDANRGIPLEARDQRERGLALTARHVSQRAPGLRGGPAVVRDRLDVDAQPANERLEQARKALRGHDDRGPHGRLSVAVRETAPDMSATVVLP